MSKIWENRASLSNHNISQIYIDISLCMGYRAGERLVLGLELLFQALCHASTVWKYLKVQKFMDQHNFETIHFKCTIPVLLCYEDITLEFKIHAAKRRLRWKKNNMQHMN